MSATDNRAHDSYTTIAAVVPDRLARSSAASRTASIEDPVIIRQAASFALIGIGVNAALYAAYLILTHTVLGAFAAMTVTYCCGVVTGFVLNGRFTFRFDGDKGLAFLRYVSAYVLGYLVNLAGLWLLVDHLGIAHEWAQGPLTVSIALMLFALQRYWVFPGSAAPFRNLAARSTP